MQYFLKTRKSFLQEYVNSFLDFVKQLCFGFSYSCSFQGGQLFLPLLGICLISVCHCWCKFKEKNVFCQAMLLLVPDIFTVIVNSLAIKVQLYKCRVEKNAYDESYILLIDCDSVCQGQQKDTKTITWKLFSSWILLLFTDWCLPIISFYFFCKK